MTEAIDINAYDELGRLSSRSIQSVDGTDTSTWAYDALGRVLQQSLAKLGVFGYEYLGDTDQVTRRTAPGGVVSTFDYGDNEADRRLTKITHPAPTGLTSPIFGGEPGHIFSYETNPLGQVTQLQSSSTRLGRGVLNQVYAYDLADRLISKTESSFDPAVPGASQTRYLRDAADNLLQIPPASVPGSLYEPTTTFQVNQLNQATTQDGGTRTHDLNGNVLMDQSSTYSWDGLDRLVRRAARTTPSVSSWRYDGWNRRAELTENGVTRRYRWCGEEICAVMDTTNKVQMLQHGDRGEVNAGRALVYGEDHLGNVRHVYSGTTGKWLAGIDYDSHGRAKDVKCVLVADCQLTTNGGLSKGYAGLYWHGPSGLYLATYRAYDPRAMRWLSRDPIEEAGGENLYAYVDGDPVNYLDPEGLQAYDGRFPPDSIPGGPWGPAGPGQQPGTFYGPPKPGGRDVCRYVPDLSNGGPAGAQVGYWKTKSPDTDWQRYDLSGVPRAPGEVHAMPTKKSAGKGGGGGGGGGLGPMGGGGGRPFNPFKIPYN